MTYIVWCHWVGVRMGKWVILLLLSLPAFPEGANKDENPPEWLQPPAGAWWRWGAWAAPLSHDHWADFEHPGGNVKTNLADGLVAKTWVCVLTWLFSGSHRKRSCNPRTHTPCGGHILSYDTGLWLDPNLKNKTQLVLFVPTRIHNRWTRPKNTSRKIKKALASSIVCV